MPTGQCFEPYRQDRVMATGSVPEKDGPTRGGADGSACSLRKTVAMREKLRDDFYHSPLSQTRSNFLNNPPAARLKEVKRAGYLRDTVTTWPTCFDWFASEIRVGRRVAVPNCWDRDGRLRSEIIVRVRRLLAAGCTAGQGRRVCFVSVPETRPTVAVDGLQKYSAMRGVQ